MKCRVCDGRGTILINIPHEAYSVDCDAKHCNAGFVAESIIRITPETLDEFWRGVYPNGMTAQDVVDELHDYHFMIGEVPKVYMEVTGHKLSKPNYYASSVIGVFNEHVQDVVEDALEEQLDTLAGNLQMPLEELKKHV